MKTWKLSIVTHFCNTSLDKSRNEQGLTNDDSSSSSYEKKLTVHDSSTSRDDERYTESQKESLTLSSLLSSLQLSSKYLLYISFHVSFSCVLFLSTSAEGHALAAETQWKRGTCHTRSWWRRCKKYYEGHFVGQDFIR